MSAKIESFDDEVIAELDRRWKAIEAGHAVTVPHSEVERWLRTWGTPEFRPYTAHPHIADCHRRASVAIRRLV